MMFFIASVHHTGTQFTEKLFKDHGYAPTDKTPRENVGNSHNDFHRAHIADSVKTELKDWLDQGLPTIVPLRHPVEVAKSWKRRKKHLQQMRAQFQLLETLVAPYEPYYLPLDHPERDLYFKEIALLDPELATDWPIVASKRAGSDHKAQLADRPFDTEDRLVMMELMELPVLKRFYYPPWRL